MQCPLDAVCEHRFYQYGDCIIYFRSALVIVIYDDRHLISDSGIIYPKALTVEVLLRTTYVISYLPPPLEFPL